MSDTEQYLNLRDINDLQSEIMRLISYWVKTEKTPVAKKVIIEQMEEKGQKDCTIINALNALLKKGYIRRAQVFSTNKTYYVQLRSI